MSSNPQSAWNPVTRAILTQVLAVAAQQFLPGSGTAIAGGLAAYQAFREALLNHFQVPPEERQAILDYIYSDAPGEAPPVPTPEPEPPPITRPVGDYGTLFPPPRPMPGDAGSLIAKGFKGGDRVFGMNGADQRWYVIEPDDAPRGNSAPLFTI